MSIDKLKNTENFAARLKTARINHGLSQEQLAEQLGVSNGAVGNWETGPTIPRPQMLRNIEELLGVRIDELLGGPLGPREITHADPLVVSHYSWMETATLEHVLSDLAARLPKSAAPERAHLLATLAEVIRQLSLRERAPVPPPAPLSEAQKIAQSAGEKFDSEHLERK
jgi:transcriptional regulator with XRE-family HTH domain